MASELNETGGNPVVLPKGVLVGKYNPFGLAWQQLRQFAWPNMLVIAAIREFDSNIGVGEQIAARIGIVGVEVPVSGLRGETHVGADDVAATPIKRA